MGEPKISPATARAEALQGVPKMPNNIKNFQEISKQYAERHGETPEQQADAERNIYARTANPNPPKANTIGLDNLNKGHNESLIDGLTAIQSKGNQSRLNRAKRIEQALEQKRERVKKMKIFAGSIAAALAVTGVLALTGTFDGVVATVGGFFTDNSKQDTPIEQIESTKQVAGPIVAGEVYQSTVDFQTKMANDSEFAADVEASNAQVRAEEDAFVEKINQDNINTQQANDKLNESIATRFADAPPMSENIQSAGRSK